MCKRCCLEPASKHHELEIEAVINYNEKYNLVLYKSITERTKGAFIRKYKSWWYFSPLLILSLMDASVPVCKRTMANNMLRAGIIVLESHDFKRIFAKYWATKLTFSNISYKRKNIFLKYVTFVYSTLSGTLNCQADKPVTLFCLEISYLLL